ncbi:ankyrin repeat domain-containing protein 50-like [Saccostrea echinata]|uniref:ankyrin repeat domain-containing protein 50-like n=1 Tax=Saccostrea echinata TaxID=191078 RepID=UPI002A8383B3|nr:ankyrin repeat domain-containing protein 50-like [Saccostrea echinata]
MITNQVWQNNSGPAKEGNNPSTKEKQLAVFEQNEKCLDSYDVLNNLHDAIKKRETKSVLEIISKNGDLVNRVLIGHTALTLAIDLKVSEVIDAVMTSSDLDVSTTDRFGRSAMYFASKTGQIPLIRKLIKLGADINQSKLLLHGCAHGGRDDETTVYELASLGADVNDVDEKNRTPLHIAVQNSLVNVTEALLQCKANVNAIENGTSRTPLMICAGKSLISCDANSEEEYSQSLKILSVLLEKGADINISDARGYTALHIALQNGNILAASVLIHQGAKSNCLKEEAVQSAYEVALSKNYLEIAFIIFLNFYRYFESFPLGFYRKTKEYLKHKQKDTSEMNSFFGALEKSLEDMYILKCSREEIVLAAREPHELLRKVPKLQNLCRHVVLQNLNLSVLKNRSIKLPTAPAIQGFIFYDTKFAVVCTSLLTDVHVAARMGDIETLGRRPIQQIVDIPFNDFSLLEVAISRKSISLTNFLLENGTDPNNETRQGLLPLHLACRQVCLEIVLLLLEFGGDVNAFDKQGNLPIHEACIAGHFDVAELLIQHGSVFDFPDINGRYPIHYSSASGNCQFTNILLQLGVNVNTTDTFGYTGLHLAASRGNLYLIKNIELAYMFERELLMKGYMFMLQYSCNTKCVPKPKYGPGVDHIKVIENMLKSGCNSMALCKMNKSAVGIARDYGFTDVMTILLGNQQ